MVSTTKATMTKKREHLGGIQTEGGPLFKNNAEDCVGRVASGIIEMMEYDPGSQFLVR